MSGTWDRQVDILVVGTGAAGLTAAIAAADAGRRVLIVESTSVWGGTTALSGGGLWMPTNPLIRKMGRDDSVAKAMTYLDAAIGDAGPASSLVRRRAFVETVPQVFRVLERLGVRWAAATDYPDYYPDRPGGMTGRGIEAEPFDVRRLGPWLSSARFVGAVPPVPLKTDDVWLLSRAWSTASGFRRGASFVFRTLWGFARGKRLYGLGAGLTANLMTIVARQGTEVLLNTPLTELVVEAGTVTGAVVSGADGQPVRVRATGGVVIAAGGFARNGEWRQKYHGIPGYTSAADGDLGDPIRIAEDIGAQLSLMDDAWWGPSVPMPDGTHQFVVSERSMPFSIVVDSSGERYTNESASYIDFGHAMLKRDDTVPAIPSWLILDARHRRRYLFASLAQGSQEASCGRHCPLGRIHRGAGDRARHGPGQAARDGGPVQRLRPPWRGRGLRSRPHGLRQLLRRPRGQTESEPRNAGEGPIRCRATGSG